PSDWPPRSPAPRSPPSLHFEVNASAPAKVEDLAQGARGDRSSSTKRVKVRSREKIGLGRLASIHAHPMGLGLERVAIGERVSGGGVEHAQTFGQPLAMVTAVLANLIELRQGPDEPAVANDRHEERLALGRLVGPGHEVARVTALRVGL